MKSYYEIITQTDVYTIYKCSTMTRSVVIHYIIMLVLTSNYISDPTARFKIGIIENVNIYEILPRNSWYMPFLCLFIISEIW